jgi:hypothetical protein
MTFFMEANQVLLVLSAADTHLLLLLLLCSQREAHALSRCCSHAVGAPRFPAHSGKPTPGSML